MKNVLDDLLRLEHDLGLDVDSLAAYPLCFLGDLSRYQKFSKRRCVAGITSCTMGADGGVRPCSHADMAYGNILSERLEQIWLEFAPWRDGSLIPSQCRTCRYLHRCGGGCRTEAKLSGDIRGLDPYATDETPVILVHGSTSSLPVTGEITGCVMRVSEDVRTRPESFGGVVAGGLSKVVFVTHETLALIESLKSVDRFDVSLLVNTYEVAPSEAITFCEQMVEHGIFLLADPAEVEDARPHKQSAAKGGDSDESWSPIFDRVRC